MSDLRFTRSDSSSIHAAAGQAECAGAGRGLLSSDGGPLAGDDPRDPLTGDAGRALFEAGVLRVSGHPGRQGGIGGSWPVTSCRGQRTEAGR